MKRLLNTNYKKLRLLSLNRHLGELLFSVPLQRARLHILPQSYLIHFLTDVVALDLKFMIPYLQTFFQIIKDVIATAISLSRIFRKKQKLWSISGPLVGY